jgi:tetratricopeptide (TPR) repeat protein
MTVANQLALSPLYWLPDKTAKIVYLYEWGHFDEQIEMLNELIEHQPNTLTPSDLTALSTVWAASGLVYRKLGSLADADKSFAKAIEIDQAQGNVSAEALHWTHRSQTHAYWGKNAGALEMIDRGKKLDEIDGNSKNLALQLGWSAALRGALGDLNGAFDLINASIRAAKDPKQPNPRHECHSILRRGDINFLSYNLHSAATDYNTSLDLAITPERHQADFEADSLRGIADCLRIQNKLDESLDTCKQALRVVTQTGNKFVEHQIRVAILRALEEYDEFRPINEFIVESEHVLFSDEFPVEIGQMHLAICRAYLKYGERSKAKAALDTAVQLISRTDHYWAKSELIYTIFLLFESENKVQLPTPLIQRLQNVFLDQETRFPLSSIMCLFVLAGIHGQKGYPQIRKWSDSERYMLSKDLVFPIGIVPPESTLRSKAKELDRQLNAYKPVFDQWLVEIKEHLGITLQVHSNFTDGTGAITNLFEPLKERSADLQLRLYGLVIGRRPTPYNLVSWNGRRKS